MSSEPVDQPEPMIDLNKLEEIMNDPAFWESLHKVDQEADRLGEELSRRAQWPPVCDCPECVRNRILFPHHCRPRALSLA